jgi:hypothetical protein
LDTPLRRAQPFEHFKVLRRDFITDDQLQFALVAPKLKDAGAG